MRLAYEAAMEKEDHGLREATDDVDKEAQEKQMYSQMGLPMEFGKKQVSDFGQIFVNLLHFPRFFL